MMWKTQPRYKSSNNIAYYREGSGTSILFIHGVGLRLESWSAQLKYLKDHFDVIAIDLPGHGESDHQTSSNKNIDSYTRMIKSFTDEIIQKKFIIFYLYIIQYIIFLFFIFYLSISLSEHK